NTTSSPTLTSPTCCSHGTPTRDHTTRRPIAAANNRLTIARSSASQARSPPSSPPAATRLRRLNDEHGEVHLRVVALDVELATDAQLTLLPAPLHPPTRTPSTTPT